MPHPKKYIGLLREMIRIPSFSGEEDRVSDLIAGFLESEGLEHHRKKNNLWCFNRNFDPAKPTILLNSHIDTVKPASGYTRDPFDPYLNGDFLYGLGSNDAGGPAVSLLAAFIRFYSSTNLHYNLCLALTAEEERSGKNGIESILDEIGPIDFAIVGEPTGMEMAIAEKGLLVIDCTTRGISGHAARKEGVNAIYKAVEDIRWFENYRFGKVSPTLGEIQMTVTVIEGGTVHNVVPDECRFTVDIRVTDTYTHEEILDIVRKNTASEVLPRSLRLRSSSICETHPAVMAGKSLGLGTFGSPTLSDQALIPAPSLKMGPGRSERSHTADEYICISEIENAIEIYTSLLEKLLEKTARNNGSIPG